MANKTIKTRIVNKHDVEANWNKAVNFIPKKGEIIVYDIDSTHECPRFKVGNGTTLISDLPFTTDVLGETTFQSDKFVQSEEFDLVKYRFKTGQDKYGAVVFGKEGPNSGAMIGLEQVEGTRRLNFRASSTPGAIVWSQPEANSVVYFDVDQVNFRGASKIIGPSFVENGTALTAKYVSKAGTNLTNQNLDDYNSYTYSGTYYAGGGNQVTNKPSGVDAFGLSIIRTASGYVTQTLYPANNSDVDIPWIRTYKAGTWTGWTQYITTKNVDNYMGLQYEDLGTI